MSGDDSIKGNGSRKSLEEQEFSSATNLIDQLPEGLLVEILIGLPCKTCFRCKSVSKRWLSIISQPYFIREFIRLRKTIARTGGHLQPALSLLKQNNYADQAKYLTCTWKEKADEFPFTLVSLDGSIFNWDRIFESSGFSLDFLPAHNQTGEPRRQSLSVVGSSRDLLLCSPTRSYQKDYYVCNPLTKQWIQLPPPPNVYHYVVIGFYSDPFIRFDDDARAGMVAFNFGFHFKVIRIQLKFDEITAPVEIFSSENGEWSHSSVITHIPFSSLVCFDRLTAGIASCGTIKWWWINAGGTFTVYDPSQNCFRVIENSNDMVTSSGNIRSIGSCRGCIRASHYNENDYAHFKVWELVDSIAGKWQLVHKVYIRKLLADDIELQQEISLMRIYLVDILIHPDDGDLVFLIFYQSIGLCNMRAMTLTPVGTSSSSILSSSLLPLQLQHWPSALCHRGPTSRLLPQGGIL